MLAWDRATGAPLSRAIVWQDRRSAGLCGRLADRAAELHIAAVLGARPAVAESGAESPASQRPILVEPPLRWISPNAITAAAAPSLGRFVLRSGEFRGWARLEARQDGRLLARSRQLRLVPGRPVHLGAAWLARVDPAGGPVRVSTR